MENWEIDRIGGIGGLKNRKFVFFYDGASWHKAKEVEDFFESNKKRVIQVHFHISLFSQIGSIRR